MNRKRLVSITMAILMAGTAFGNICSNVQQDSPCMISASAASSGSCGSNLRWSISGDTLKITGSGKMNDYGSSSNKAPWRSSASAIKKVILPKGLTTIGNYAFYNMTALEYVYTNDGMNMPCLPDVTSIGTYAFSGCTAFRGCTQNGVLTLGLGTDSVMLEGTLEIKKCAFRDCDQVRFLNCNFKTMKVSAWGFYDMNRLTTLNLQNTRVQLGKEAFSLCRNLATVNVLPSELTIHNTAFNSTKYRTSGCKETTPNSLNHGAATALTGKQLVVNFFVDRTMVDLTNTYTQSRIGSLARNEHYTPNEGEIVCSFYDTSHQEWHDGIYKESSMRASYKYGWNPQKSSNQANPTANSVITLNKINYANVFDQNRISISMIQNGYTSGFFGSYVESDFITNRLNDVRAAMNDLQSQAAEYGSSFTYEMHPETNFHITYDFFDWSTKRAKEGNQGQADRGFDETIGYNSKIPYISVPRMDGSLPHAACVYSNKGDKLFSSILEASRNLSGDKAQTIDLLRDGNETSPYTEYLKNKYNVSSVIYLIHFNTSSQAETYGGDMDELSIICEMPGYSTVPEIIAHESAHLFGARDCYSDPRSSHKTPIQQYALDYFDNELMMSKGTKVSPVTAFYLGWRTWLDTPSWDTFFG